MNETRVYRVTIANVHPDHVVKRASLIDLPITAVASVGYNPKWDDIEHGTTFETAHSSFATIAGFVVNLLTELSEESAYITRDGAEAFLLDVDSQVTAL